MGTNSVKIFLSLLDWNPQNYWTSGTDLGEEGAFFWASNGQPISLNKTFWLANQPDNASPGEHCVHLWHSYAYLLNDVSCEMNYSVICEIGQRSPSDTTGVKLKNAWRIVH